MFWFSQNFVPPLKLAGACWSSLFTDGHFRLPQIQIKKKNSLNSNSGRRWVVSLVPLQVYSRGKGLSVPF